MSKFLDNKTITCRVPKLIETPNNYIIAGSVYDKETMIPEQFKTLSNSMLSPSGQSYSAGTSTYSSSNTDINKKMFLRKSMFNSQMYYNYYNGTTSNTAFSPYSCPERNTQNEQKVFFLGNGEAVIAYNCDNALGAYHVSIAKSSTITSIINQAALYNVQSSNASSSSYNGAIAGTSEDEDYVYINYTLRCLKNHSGAPSSNYLKSSIAKINKKTGDYSTGIVVFDEQQSYSRCNEPRYTIVSKMFKNFIFIGTYDKFQVKRIDPETNGIYTISTVTQSAFPSGGAVPGNSCEIDGKELVAYFNGQARAGSSKLVLADINTTNLAKVAELDLPSNLHMDYDYEFKYYLYNVNNELFMCSVRNSHLWAKDKYKSYPVQFYMHRIDKDENGAYTSFTLVANKSLSDAQAYISTVNNDTFYVSICPTDNTTYIGGLRKVVFDWTKMEFIEEAIQMPTTSVGQIGLDYEDRLYISGSDGIFRYDNETVAYVDMKFKEDSYKFNGENVPGIVLVSTRNLEKTQVTASLELTIQGNAKFDETNSKTIEIQTLPEESVEIPFTIVGHGPLSIYPKVVNK